MIKKIAVFLLLNQSLHAEIITDGSLGDRVTLTAPDYQITQELGKTVGTNLFHSFEKFNLTQGEIATFSGSTHIENIVTRVTGGFSSTLDGTLRSTLPQANLYFINPHGVIFGQNAQLDLTGSAYFSTADVVKFADSEQFTANLNINNLLTVAAPSAFGFLTASPAPLLINNSQLHLDGQQILSLSSGQLKLDGAHLHIPEGMMELISVAAPMEINLNGQLTQATDNQTFNAFGNITLNNSILQVTGDHGGGFILRGKNIALNNSQLLARTLNYDGRDIDIQAENFKMEQSLISASTDGLGQSGTIEIKLNGNLLIDKGSQIAANTRVESAYGNAGTARLRAKTIQIFNESGIQNTTFSKGQGGKIELEASDKIEMNTGYIRAISLELPPEVTSIKDFDVSKIKATDVKFGNAGDITITTDQFIATQSLLTSSTITGGDAGTINLNANSIHLNNGSAIASNTFSTGQAGKVNIHAKQEVSLDRSLVFANSESNLIHGGNAGAVTLTTDKLLMTRGSQLSITTFTDGNSGTVRVHANHAIFDGYSMDGEGYVYSSGLETATFNSGNGGQIQLVANRLELKNGAKIDSSTYGNGRAGTIYLDIAQAIQISADSENLTQAQYNSLGRGIISSSNGINSGNAGNLFIRTPQLTMTQHGRISTSAQQAQAGTITIDTERVWLQQAEISSESEGDGNAGNIALNVTEQLSLINSKISTQAQHAAGGNISLEINGQWLHLGQGAITTSVKGGMGGGGNITVTKPEFVVLNDSQTIAQADGGNILISAHHFINSPDSLVSASSRRGIDGAVKINAPESDNYCGLVNLPSDFFNADQLLKKQCHQEDLSSSFTIKQVDGIPNLPDDLQNTLELTRLIPLNP